METKRCSKCKEVKPVSEFYKDRSRPDGYMYSCKACRKVRYAEYREEHREEIAAQRKEYDAAYNKEYYKEHRDERAAYDKEHEQTAEGKEVRRKANSKRRALKLGAAVGAVNEAAIYERDKACVYCGSKEDLTIDHVVALNDGGSHKQDNLVVACRSCNSRKSDTPLEEWLRRERVGD